MKLHSRRPRALALPLAICLALIAAPAFSTDASAPDPGIGTARHLPAVKVTGTYPLVELDVPGTTSVIDRQQMDRHLVTTIRDLVRYEPGVSAIGTSGRFGLDSFNIRGLSGNRTYMEIDGVPMAGSFGADIAGGSFRAGRDYIDLDEIKRVRIIRGPASALYPSDALGGSVILETRDPGDYLRDGKSTWGAVKGQYNSADRSYATTVSLASGDRHNGLLVTAGHRDGHETANRGDIGGVGAARTRPDPMHYRQDSLLGKYVHTADSGRRDRVAVDASRRRVRIDSLSALEADGYPSFYRGNDTQERVRTSIGQDFEQLGGVLADSLDWHAYWQQSRTRTDTDTDTDTLTRYFSTVPLQERVLGGKLVATRHVGEGAVTQTLSYGLDVSRTHVTSDADGYGVDKRSGASGSDKAFMPGDYPLHLIPPSDTDRQALFVQDRIEWFDGRLVVTPGLRVERYAYKPDADPLYLKYNAGYQPRDYTEHHVSPKLGVIWRLRDGLGVYANYADGFRPPLYSDIAGSWNEQPIAGFNIAFLPNDDLKAETSRNLEIGLRGQGDAGWFNVAAYENRYRDFIWSGYQLSPEEVPDWAHQISPGAFANFFFQAVNARRARIRGVEAAGQLRLGALGDAWDGWSLRASASVASGRLVQPGDETWSPLDTVDPAKLVVGIGYDAAHWGAQLVGTGVRRHVRLANPDGFRPGGYATLDLYVRWEPTEHLALHAGATNLTDRKYWDWGNLNGGVLGNLVSGNGLNDSGTGGIPADRLSMPGRAFSVSARLTF